MALPYLSNLELQTEQAKAEGFVDGPAPRLNNANINTQYIEGNTSLPADLPPLVPYYPGLTETPNMGLSLINMEQVISNNFQIIDAASLTTGKAVLTLTAAQILQIQSTPIQVIPAPGVGYFVQIQQVVFKYSFGTTQYTVGGAVPAWVLYYNGGADATAVSVSNSTFMNGTQNGVALAVLTGINDGNYPADFDNLAVNVKIGAGGANPTGGDGTITIEVWYFLNQFIQPTPIA